MYWAALPGMRRGLRTVYCNSDGEVLGCDVCVKTMDAWEAEECFPAVMEVI